MIFTTLGNQKNNLIVIFNKCIKDLEQQVTSIKKQAIAEHTYLEKQQEGTLTNLIAYLNMLIEDD